MGLSNFAKKLLDKSGSMIMNYFLPTGEQYCPYCHIKISHRDEGYYECEICNYSITDEEADYGDGYPTLESTYEDDLYNNDLTDDEKPSQCEICGGPYPHCRTTCGLFIP